MPVRGVIGKEISRSNETRFSAGTVIGLEDGRSREARAGGNSFVKLLRAGISADQAKRVRAGGDDARGAASARDACWLRSAVSVVISLVPPMKVVRRLEVPERLGGRRRAVGEA